jgi:hypothetical protein
MQVTAAVSRSAEPVPVTNPVGKLDSQYRANGVRSSLVKVATPASCRTALHPDS